MGAEAWTIPWDTIKVAAQRYLDTCVSAKDKETLRKQLKSRTEDKVHDTGWSEDTAMRVIMLDWAADHAGELRKKKPKAIAQACYYFVIFRDKSYDIPLQIRERLDKKDVDDMLKHLNDEADKAAKVGATSR
jgi:hypothetical protein